ncbi:hypothetical protein CA2559_09583 [Croceibacter atlanticus HTCC2559]|uniref:Uncharacterized protein n=1 Tax=Croceibacter atlanticus (strain ATCC BAA-628 / JCM 21780 / CIP 108009 / IAM 15332 / KCTC 12090 / HTCC2559) TaxID=216432 RepID=A3U8Y9_CROAH|nr:hypothetical protein CA2559_09583 [Croceibacter atlanticus HTCC2559]
MFLSILFQYTSKVANAMPKEKIIITFVSKELD